MTAIMDLFGPQRMSAPRPRTPVRPIGFLDNVDVSKCTSVAPSEFQLTEVSAIAYPTDRSQVSYPQDWSPKLFDQEPSARFNAMNDRIAEVRERTFFPSGNSNSMI